jgi:hypothetical protein
MNMQMPNPAVNAMNWMRATRKFPSGRMRFTSSVLAAMRTLMPARLWMNVPDVMSDNPNHMITAGKRVQLNCPEVSQEKG